MDSNTQKKSYKHKPHYCIFCKTEFPRIHQHFLRKHEYEQRVREIQATTDKKQRFWMWKRLTQEGDHYFNNQVEGKLGQRKIVKQPVRESRKKKYFTCLNCLGRIRITSRRQHEKICTSILTEATDSAGEWEIGELTQDIYAGVSEWVINRLRKSLHMNAFIQHLDEIKNNKSVIRTAMTDLIQLEEKLQEIKNDKKCLTKFLFVCEVDSFVTAIKSLCGQHQVNKEKVIKYPFRALRLCRLIKQLVNFLIVYYSKKNMDKNVMEMNKFIAAFQSDCDQKIRKKASVAIKQRELKNPTKIPKLSDIKILIEHLKSETPRLMEMLKTQKTARAWKDLAENTLCRLTIFNRRRGGAIEKMKVNDYINTEIRSKVSTEEAIFDLQEDEKNFLENIKVVEILHKCNNLVPIVINKNLQEPMDLLLEYREYADINKKNEYFFAAGNNSLNPMGGVRVMEKCRKCLPENVQKLVTATSLRKHGATTTQLLDLSVQDKEEWAHHLGHTVEVHNKYYRNKELVQGILKTGKILTALDEGTLKYFKGKKLADIPITGVPEEGKQ